MTGVLERALGEDWTDLHPNVRERYGLSTDGEVQTVVGRGTMDRLSTGRHLRPALALGPLRNTLFHESGSDVPFEIRTEAFVDEHGREAVAFRRTFEVTDALGRQRTRRFDSTMVWDEERGTAIDYLGSGAELAVDVDVAADDGALLLRSGAARLTAGGRSIPLPDALNADVTVRDWYDEAVDRYRVALSVDSPVGYVFGFEGSFTQETRGAADPTGDPRRSAVSVTSGSLPR